MTDTRKTEPADEKGIPEQKGPPAAEEQKPQQEAEEMFREAHDKYVRLYADFENYKKITARNREELLKYANEDLIKDILTVVDHLELALQHAPDNEKADSLAEGVQLTLKELLSVLEKYGLETIEAVGRPFDPAVHHAMTQVESEDAGENTVVKEFRKGYSLKGRVLRAALVGVAVKPSSPGERADTGASEGE